jgi:hypothetical protein
MPKHTCDNCKKSFAQKGHLEDHLKRKRPCKKDITLEELVEKKVQEIISNHLKIEPAKFDTPVTTNHTLSTMDYSKMTIKELTALCKEKGIKGYSGKKKADILILITKYKTSKSPETLGKQDTGKFRTNMKDQFYTDEKVAKTCINQIITLLPHTTEYVWVEPSAGNGAFLHNIPPSYEKIGLDLDPKAKDIIKQDYLKWSPPEDRDIIIFGNPPFGRQSSLAKSFISKSCKVAKVIAFILPKSFTKPSMFSAFDLKFHLIYSKELEKDSFVINGSKYDVPCVFQIWEKKNTDRIIEDKIESVGFRYVKPTEKYDVVFRRVGGLAGKCYRNDGTDYSIQSHYFIKFDDKSVPLVETIIGKINKHIFPSNTLGPRSLSKSEANIVINEIIHSVSS